jgi:sugar O-acyltransferase (sialic acid O-acetyltransferase NeuD family)
MDKVVLIGGGGHASSVLDALLSSKEYDVVGITDPSVRAGEKLLGIPFLGNDEILSELFNSGVKAAFIAVGSIGNTSLRVKLYESVKKIGFTLPVVKDPSAIIGRGCHISEGTFIGKGVIINALSEIGKMAIINSKALIEHECKIGAYCHIAPGSILGGNVLIGEHTHVGIGSIVLQGINVGHHSLIGAGSVVVKNIGEHKKAYGNPCNEVR